MSDEPRTTLAPGRFVVLGGSEPDDKRASFRLSGDGLDPDVVSKALGLKPHRAHRKGESRPGKSGDPASPRPWRSGLWSLDSEKTLPRSAGSLEDHVSCLLDQLEPVAPALRQLCADHALDADFFCGYFMHQSNSGFALSPRTLARIADLDATFGVDMYGPDPDDEDRTSIVEPGS